MADLRLEYLPMAQIAPAPKNPKGHHLATVGASLKRFGYVAPMVMDEATGRLVVGHGRLEALRAAKEAGAPPPDRVSLDPATGDWLVPVMRGVAFRDAKEAAAYLIADNQTTILGKWDDAELGALLAEVAQSGDLSGIGFSTRAIDRLIREASGAAAEDPGAQIDRAAELQAKWQCARGQLWQVGAHRLLCGDATSAEDVARLMAGERAALFSTDPPYLVDYTGDDRPKPGKDWSKLYVEPPKEGAAAFYHAVFAAAEPILEPHAAWYVWHASVQALELLQVWRERDLINHQQIIWVKPFPILTYSYWAWRHEPCLMGWKRGHKPAHDGDNSSTVSNTVWELDWEGGSRGKGTAHPTEKPVELFRRPMGKHTAPGDLCYEPFSGSGAQLVAAEQMKRRCYGMEITPAFVAVALERLAGMGLTPELVP
jgi:DNA modification methylase